MSCMVPSYFAASVESTPSSLRRETFGLELRLPRWKETCFARTYSLWEEPEGVTVWPVLDIVGELKEYE